MIPDFLKSKEIEAPMIGSPVFESVTFPSMTGNLNSRSWENKHPDESRIKEQTNKFLSK